MSRKCVSFEKVNSVILKLFNKHQGDFIEVCRIKLLDFVSQILNFKVYVYIYQILYLFVYMYVYVYIIYIYIYVYIYRERDRQTDRQTETERERERKRERDRQIAKLDFEMADAFGAFGKSLFIKALCWFCCYLFLFRFFLVVLLYTYVDIHM